MSEKIDTQLTDNTDTDIANENQQPETAENDAADSAPADDKEEATEAVQPQSQIDMNAFAAAIAEAEERGYRRGCAQANVQQAQPEQTQRQPYQVPAGDNNQNNSTPTFLSHIRTGFWD